VYHSDVIVRADSPYRTLADLRGAVFAFVDPMSFSGDLAVRALLAEQGYDPKSFFRRVIYTSSHDNSITAVLSGLVDGAAVDSHTLAGFLERHPAERAEIRVVARSFSAGNPPFVAGPVLDSGLRRQLQEAFLQMDRDPEGRAALQAMGVERFAPPSERLYDPVRRAEELVRGRS
ncbi:MAG: PhnD/SsuA/transferrin family substrate-binding protein, partial [Meiothermus silvanus]|nr:PhnD/SsuA/transferrin family substrate-binding protein [Allomeiothermus silvanus]